MDEAAELLDHLILIVFRQFGVEGDAQATLEKAFRTGETDFSHHSFEIRVPVKGDVVNLRQDVPLLEELVSQVSSSFLLEANDEQMPCIARINLRKIEMIAKRLLIEEFTVSGSQESSFDEKIIESFQL